MSLFVCEKCGCVENTALGFYHVARIPRLALDGGWWDDKSLEGLVLCSECAPAKFSDGSSSRMGKWHGQFPKRKPTPEDYRESRGGLRAGWVPPLPTKPSEANSR